MAGGDQGRRWRPAVEGANLRQLFVNGEADPHQGTNKRAGIPHMNRVFNNNKRLFPNVTSERNFYNGFRRTAAEFLLNQTMTGQRRRDQQGQHGGTFSAYFNCLIFLLIQSLCCRFSDSNNPPANAEGEEEEDLPSETPIVIEEIDDEDDVVEELEPDSVDNMDGITRGLQLTNIGRPRNLPPTTAGLFVITPLPYLNVLEGRHEVKVRFIAPSGMTEERSVFQVIHGGWTLRFRGYFPDWFLNATIVLQADSDVNITTAEVTAFDDGIATMRENDQERIFRDWLIALPIRVEENIAQGDVDFQARHTEGHNGQYTSFFTVKLRGHYLGRRTAATPNRIRIIGFDPSGTPAPVGSGGIPFAQAFPVSGNGNAMPGNPPQAVPVPPQGQQGGGSNPSPPHVAGNPMQATPASIQRDLSNMTDTELACFETALDELIQAQSLNMTTAELAQAQLIKALTMREILARRSSPQGFNP